MNVCVGLHRSVHTPVKTRGVRGRKQPWPTPVPSVMLCWSHCVINVEKLGWQIQAHPSAFKVLKRFNFLLYADERVPAYESGTTYTHGISEEETLLDLWRLWAILWVLGSMPWSSARAASTLDHWTISLVMTHVLIRIYFIHVSNVWLILLHHSLWSPSTPAISPFLGQSLFCSVPFFCESVSAAGIIYINFLRVHNDIKRKKSTSY